MKWMWVCVVCLSGCGMGGDFEYQGKVVCTDGRELDLREWKPYIGVLGTRSWLENTRTGERIDDDGVTKCYPVSHVEGLSRS